jgi:hypothetical protein
MTTEKYLRLVRDPSEILEPDWFRDIHPPSAAAERETYYDQPGHLHRSNGPAVIERDRATGRIIGEAWYTHGKLDRADGPAIVEYDRLTGAIRSTKWYENGEPVKPPVFPESRSRQYYNPTRHHFDI